MKRDYDDERELHRYLWENYRHALGKRVHDLYLAATLELKAKHTDSGFNEDFYRKMPYYFIDSDMVAIAEMGLGTFQKQCCERLLRDYGTQIYINRCERCQRIVASPIACACVWCGHHWYERRSEMIARSASPIYPENQ